MDKKLKYRQELIEYDKGENNNRYCRKKGDIDIKTGLGFFTQGFKVRVYLAVNAVTAASVIEHLRGEGIKVGSYFNRLSSELNPNDLKSIVKFVNDMPVREDQALKIEVGNNPFNGARQISSIDELEAIFLNKSAQIKVQNSYKPPIINIVEFNQNHFSNNGENYHEDYLKSTLQRYVIVEERKLILLQSNYPSQHKRKILNGFLKEYHASTKTNVISIDLSNNYKSVARVLKNILSNLNADTSSINASSALTDYFRLLGSALTNRKTLFVFIGYRDSNYASNDHINTSSSSQKNWAKLLDILFQVDSLTGVDLQVLLTTNSINNAFNNLPFKPVTIPLRTNIMTSKVTSSNSFVGSFIGSIKDRSIVDNQSVDFLLNFDSNIDRSLRLFLKEERVKLVLLNLFYEKGIVHLKFVLTALSLISREDIIECRGSLDDNFNIYNLLKLTSPPILLLLTMLCLSEGGIALKDLKRIKKKYINKKLFKEEQFLPGTNAFYLKSAGPKDITEASYFLSYVEKNERVYLTDRHLRQFFVEEAKSYFQEYFGGTKEVIMILIHQELAKIQLGKLFIELEREHPDNFNLNDPITNYSLNQQQKSGVIVSLSDHKSKLPSEARINAVVNAINHLLHLADPKLGISNTERPTHKLFDIRFLSDSLDLVTNLDIKRTTVTSRVKRNLNPKEVLELANMDIIAFCYSIFYFAIDLKEEHVSARFIESGNMLRFNVFERFYFLKEKGSIANHTEITNLPLAVLNCFIKHDCFTKFVESFLLSAAHLSKFSLVKSILANRRNARYINKLTEIEVNNSETLNQKAIKAEVLNLAPSKYSTSIKEGTISRIALIRLKSMILSGDLLEAKTWGKLLIENGKDSDDKNYKSVKNNLLRVNIALGEYSNVRNILFSLGKPELEMLDEDTLREVYGAMIRLKLLNYNINEQFKEQFEIVINQVDKHSHNFIITGLGSINVIKAERKKANNHIHLQILKCYQLMMESEIVPNYMVKERNEKRKLAIIEIEKIQNHLINIQYLSTSPFISLLFKISQLRCEMYRCHVTKTIPSEIYELKLRALLLKTNGTYPLFYTSILVMLCDYLVFKRSFNPIRNHQPSKVYNELLSEYADLLVELSMVIEKHHLLNRLSELNKLGIFHQWEYEQDKSVPWLVC